MAEVKLFVDDDPGYRAWLGSHPLGYVVNAYRSLSPTYMVLHKATCARIGEYTRRTRDDGFTGQGYVKACGGSVQELRDWVTENGRPRGDFSALCPHCRPIAEGGAADTSQDGPMIRFDELTVGRSYERPFLAGLWGYADWHALGRGIVTPSGSDTVVLFITKVKQAALEQYVDDFDGEFLYMEGETNHANDRRLTDSPGNDQVHLFYREQHHDPFVYHGEVFLSRATLHDDRPSHFMFAVAEDAAAAMSGLAVEATGSGPDTPFVPDEEGKRRVRQYVEYERSPRNRARALEIHGRRCQACGFDFNETYGEDLANGFIEVHHIRSITEVEGPVDPATDLVPLCANCHRIVHRRRGEILGVSELRERLGRDA